jgi:hypothetical protein
MDLEKTLKWIGAITTLVGLALGVMNYLATVRRDAETRNLEARKQYVTRQLDLYTDATRAAAKIATSKPESPEYTKAFDRFWELYWGELSMIETTRVEAAMKNMGDCLLNKGCRCGDLQHCSLELANACRRSLADSWGIPEWQY